MGTAKEALGGGRAVGAPDVVVVHGGERRELAVAQAMATMVMQSQLTVATGQGLVRQEVRERRAGSGSNFEL